MGDQKFVHGSADTGDEWQWGCDCGEFESREAAAAAAPTCATLAAREGQILHSSRMLFHEDGRPVFDDTGAVVTEDTGSRVLHFTEFLTGRVVEKRVEPEVGQDGFESFADALIQEGAETYPEGEDDYFLSIGKEQRASLVTRLVAAWAEWVREIDCEVERIEEIEHHDVPAAQAQAVH